MAVLLLTVGLATALEKVYDQAAARIARWRRLRDRHESGLVAVLGPDRVIRNGPADASQRLPQTVNLGFPGIDGNTLLLELDVASIAASLGLACASGSTQPVADLDGYACS